MKFKTLSKVTIVAEPVLKDELIAGIMAHGAPGYTVSEATGTSSRDPHRAKRVVESVQIEIVCAPETAREIMTYVAETYSEHYSCAAWASTVEVIETLAKAASA